MKGQGHSGGLVYHYKTHRVIGLVTEGYKSDVMLNTGLATRFKPLFKKWREFQQINQVVVLDWVKRLLEEKQISDISTATRDNGTYGEHLRRIVMLLNRDKLLLEAMQKVLQDHSCPSSFPNSVWECLPRRSASRVKINYVRLKANYMK